MAMNESRSNYEDLAERYIINRQKLSQKMRMNEDDDHPLSQKEDVGCFGWTSIRNT